MDRPYFMRPFRLRTGSKNLSSASHRWEYTKSYFKENAKIFLKSSTTQRKYYNFKTKIRLQNIHKKENLKPEIKPMIENLQDELYQLENKHKVLKIVLTLEVGGQKMFQNFLESTWKRKYAKSNNIWINHDNKYWW